MRNSPTPLPAQEGIAGLVDGSIVLTRDADGSLSIKLALGPTSAEHPGDNPLVEIGLSEDSARDLSQFLLSDGGQAMRLNCCVGVRAREA